MILGPQRHTVDRYELFANEKVVDRAIWTHDLQHS